MPPETCCAAAGEALAISIPRNDIFNSGCPYGLFVPEVHASRQRRLQCFIGEVQFRATQTAAGAAGVTLHSLPIQSPDDFQAAFDRAARERTIHGVVVLSSPLILEQRSQIAEWALKARLISSPARIKCTGQAPSPAVEPVDKRRGESRQQP